MPKPAAINEADVRFMRRAIRLARRGEGRVEPNPMVGCVLVRDGVILSQGWHRRFGGPHAEVEALKACSLNPAGATAYVSLEPCCHFGKTPPCTKALIEAGLSRVVIPASDPNPAVAGSGIAALRNAGIRVDVGVLRDEAAELLAPFLTRIQRRRPYVIAKWAQSLDGKLATQSGDSKWISGEPARRLVHQLRARVDAVIVGSETIRIDDSLLTARDVPIKRLAARVVLDGRLRISPKASVVQSAGDAPTLVFTTSARAGSPAAKRLARHGVEVIPVPSPRGKLALTAVLRVLFDRGMTNVLVEGGPTLLSAFLRAGIVDETWVFVAAKWLGGRDLRMVTLPPARTIPEASSPASTHLLPLGQDAFFRCLLNDPLALLPPS